MPPRRMIAVSLAAAVWLLPVSAQGGQAAAQVEQRFKTGAELDRALDAAVGIQWSENPLRRALAGVAEANKVAIFLDRNVDPGKRINFEARGPLREVLALLAKENGLALARVGPVIYVGPLEVTRRISTLLAVKEEEARLLPESTRRRLAEKAPSRWTELSAPRELVVELSAASGLAIENDGAIPHDLWAASALPPLTFVERLTLLLAGFGLTFEFSADGGGVRPVAAAEEAAWRRVFTPSRFAPGLVGELTKRFPRAEIRASGRDLAVTANFADMAAIEEIVNTGRVTRPAPADTAGGETRIDKLDFRNQPAGPVLETLARRLGLEVSFASTVSDEQRSALISVSVRDVSIAELLAAIGKEAGLRIEVEGKRVTVSPLQ